MLPKNDTRRPMKSRRKSRWRRNGVMSMVARCIQDGTGRKHETLDCVTYSIVARDPETGELGVAVQSHYFQVGPLVPWALARAGPLAVRFMAALDAAEAEGGDIRGKQSAAMLVVRGAPTGRSWEDRIIDLRVEDSPEPLIELRRLLDIRRAYDVDSEADKLDEA